MVDDLGSFPRPVLGALAAAERLLSRRAGAAIVLADPEDLGGSDRSVVARARVARNPFSLPRTLVVKHYRRRAVARPARPVPVRGGERQLFTSMSPRAAAQPRAHRPRPGRPAARHGGPRAQLHARRQALRARRRRRAALPAVLGAGARPDAGGHGGPGEGLRRAPAPPGRARLARPDGRRGARRVRGRAGPAARRARASVARPPPSQEAHDTARLLGGTRYRAFSPSDTCPDNNLVTSRGVRFVDFEWGCFRDIALDAAYFRVPFPGCEASFALPPGMADTLLDAWRNEIAAVWPDLDEPGRLTPASSTRSCCGCGCARGGCCRGRISGCARPAPIGHDAGALAPDQHRAVALLGPAGRRRRRRREGGDGRAWASRWPRR